MRVRNTKLSRPIVEAAVQPTVQTHKQPTVRSVRVGKAWVRSRRAVRTYAGKPGSDEMFGLAGLPQQVSNAVDHNSEKGNIAEGWKMMEKDGERWSDGAGENYNANEMEWYRSSLKY